MFQFIVLLCSVVGMVVAYFNPGLAVFLVLASVFLFAAVWPRKDGE